jgi:hypothetical protein
VRRVASGASGTISTEDAVTENQWRDSLRDADKLAAEIMRLDGEMPGLAIMVVRGVIQRLSPSDAATLLKPPQPVSPLRFDPKVLIG